LQRISQAESNLSRFFSKLGKFRDIWNTEKDGKQAEKRSFIRYAILATAVFLLLVGFLNQNNFVRWIKAGIEIRQQEKQMERYQREIKEMDNQIHGLTTSKDSLEQYAREHFNFAEPGDDVYLEED
jgi:cell division protein FtsB